MYERCLNEAERILATHRDVIVPVRQVWREVVEESKKQQFEVPDFADFTAMLEGDLRFDFLPATDAGPDLPSDGEGGDVIDEQEAMESLGFFEDDRVRLRRVNLKGEPLGMEDEMREAGSSIAGKGGPTRNAGSSGKNVSRRQVSGKRRPTPPASLLHKKRKITAQKSRGRKRTANASGGKRTAKKGTSRGAGRKRHS